MYPVYDFLSQVNAPDEELWRSMLREPLEELLDYWVRTDRPDELRKTYQHGLREGVIRNRWALPRLKLVGPHPEFHSAVRDGLMDRWAELRFGFKTELLIDSTDGITLNWSYDEKSQLIDRLKDKFTIGLMVDSIPVTVGVTLSPQARDIFELIHWLDSTGN